MNVQFETQDNQFLTLNEMKEGKNQTMIVFVRHLGWPICREYLTQLRERINEFEEKHVTIYVIAPSTARFIKQFLDAFGPFPFPIVGDPDRQAYHQMEHHTSPKWKLLSKALLGVVFRKVKNFIPKDPHQKEVVLTSMKTADIYIQGGTYLYTSDGELFWKHVDTSPEDHAQIDTVLNQLS